MKKERSIQVKSTWNYRSTSQGLMKFGSLGFAHFYLGINETFPFVLCKFGFETTSGLGDIQYM